MLILNRREGEVIEIQTPLGTIEVKVYEIHTSRVRLNITAPKSFAVHRQEVADAIRREEAAAQLQLKGKP